MKDYILYSVIILLCLLIIGIYILMRIRLNKVIKSTRNTLLNIQNSIPSLNGKDRLDYTNNLLAFIESSVTSEIINIRRFEIILGKKNKNLDVENVITDVSKKVFESIKSDIFNDPNLIVTSDYLISFIQKRTTAIYISYLNENMSGEN